MKRVFGLIAAVMLVGGFATVAMSQPMPEAVTEEAPMAMEEGMEMAGNMMGNAEEMGEDMMMGNEEGMMAEDEMLEYDGNMEAGQ